MTEPAEPATPGTPAAAAAAHAAPAPARPHGRSPALGLPAALLLGAGIALGGWFVGQGLERQRMASRTVTVKGLAEREVAADYAVWVLGFRRAGREFADVQTALARDREQVLAFLQQLGFKPDEVEAMPLQVEDLFARDYAQGGQPLRFSGAGRVLVRTARVAEVEAAARKVDPLVQAGVQLAGDNNNGGGGAGGPRYELRKFNDVKAPLLAEATRHAREQAAKFAADSGAELGRLRSANQGVVQISGTQGGGEGDDGASRIKRLRVVSTFEYELR